MKITVLTGSPRAKTATQITWHRNLSKEQKKQDTKCTDLTAQDIKSLPAEPAAHAE